MGDAVGPEVYMGRLGTAERDGQEFSAGVEVGVSTGFDASLQVSHALLSAALGFDVNNSFSITVTAYSGALKKGQTAYGYYRLNYRQYKVTQQRIYHQDGMTFPMETKTTIVNRLLGSAQTRIVVSL